MNIQDEIKKNIAREIQKETVSYCPHSFVNANDGTNDKICIICGKRAMQAVMYYKSTN